MENEKNSGLDAEQLRQDSNAEENAELNPDVFSDENETNTDALDLDAILAEEGSEEVQEDAADISVDDLIAESNALMGENAEDKADAETSEEPAEEFPQDDFDPQTADDATRVIPSDDISAAVSEDSDEENLDQILDEASSMCELEDEIPEEENVPEEPQETPEDAVYEDTPSDLEEIPDSSSKKAGSGEKKSKGRRKKEIPAKRRPEHKKGYGFFGIPHILATLVWLALIVAIGVSLGRIVWVCAADMLAFGKEEGQVTISITDSDGPDEISQKLKDAGLIRYPKLFRMFMQIKGADEEITTGTFTLNTMYDYNALVNSMTPYAEGRQEVEVVIPEGYTCAQIFQLLEDNEVCSVADLEAYAASGELGDYWFLDGITRGDRYCLEGYLFPDTYKFYTDDDADRVIEKFLDAFEYRFTDTMREWMDTLNERLTAAMEDAGRDEEYIQDHLMDIHKIITIASMIEKESSGPDESRIISSVIYNRLTDWEYPYLNIDATIIYALGGKDGPLTESDLQVDSPYNTYTNMGLTPGPISNPGRESIYAALDPMETDYDYYYYALDPETGKHEFFRTQEGFEEFLETVDYGE